MIYFLRFLRFANKPRAANPPPSNRIVDGSGTGAGAPANIGIAETPSATITRIMLLPPFSIGQKAKGHQSTAKHQNARRFRDYGNRTTGQHRNGRKSKDNQIADHHSSSSLIPANCHAISRLDQDQWNGSSNHSEMY